MTASEDWLDSPSEILSRVYASEAYMIRTRLLTLDTNFYVFDRNYQDLKRAIDAYSQTEHIPLLFRQTESQVILYEMVRLLHNYLAAAKMLVEHTRTLINDSYRDSAFLDEYGMQVKTRFSANQLTGFVEDLRNYALHFSLPITGFRFEVRVDPQTQLQTERVVFFIDRETLTKWTNWSKGKEYLRTADSEINIERLSDDYYGQILNLHSWMHQRLQQIHVKELEWLSAMDQRLNALVPARRNYVAR